ALVGLVFGPQRGHAVGKFGHPTNVLLQHRLSASASQSEIEADGVIQRLGTLDGGATDGGTGINAAKNREAYAEQDGNSDLRVPSTHAGNRSISLAIEHADQTLHLLARGIEIATQEIRQRFGPLLHKQSLAAPGSLVNRDHIARVLNDLFGLRT